MVNTLYKLADGSIKEMRKNERTVMTAKDEHRRDTDNICHLCNEEICKRSKTKSNYKLRDHDHRAGNYRGPAHLTCYINYSQNR